MLPRVAAEWDAHFASTLSRLTVSVHNVAAMQVHQAGGGVNSLGQQSSSISAWKLMGAAGCNEQRSMLQPPPTIASRRCHVSWAAMAGSVLAARRQSKRLTRAQYSVMSAGGSKHSPAKGIRVR